MPERRYGSKEIEELWGIPQAVYQKACRAKRVDKYADDPNAKRKTYRSTARQIERWQNSLLSRAR